MHRKIQQSVLAASLLVAVALPMSVAPAADLPFAGYVGAWNGVGQMALTNGDVESIRCKAYYTGRDGGQGLGIALRCAAASNSVEFRASLTANGERVTGTWEERTFNATGAIIGKAAAGKLDLTIDGSGFTGSMQVATDGLGQKVAIRAEGIVIKSINVSFARAEQAQR
jgi:hypothetical protein